MSIANIMHSLFGGAATTPQSVQPNTQGGPNPNAPTGNPTPGQGLPGTVSNQNTAPNGMIPTNDGIKQPAPGEPAAPLSTFQDVWQTPAIDPNAKPETSMFGNLDPKKLLESARTVDFSKAISAENMAAIKAGGESGLNATIAAMNQVAQQGYAQSAMATTKIVEQALEKQAQKFNEMLPSLVRKLSVNESLRAENPLLSNPAIQPLVGALTEQLNRKNPNATAAEIQSQVNDYFAQMGTVFAPKPVESADQSRSRAMATDWDKFLES